MSRINLYLAIFNMVMFAINFAFDERSRVAWGAGFLMAMCWAISESQLLERA